MQLPFAGVENFVHLLDDERVWACGKGVYAEPVAELALTLGLAGLRGLGDLRPGHVVAAAAGPQPSRRPCHHPRRGRDHHVARAPAAAVRCHITVVRRRAEDLAGVDDVLDADRYADALPGADLVVLALALTPETEGLIAADELALMEDHAWLVNVARGKHVVTDDLVDALRDGVIGGAGLDVTDPEPLPPEHPLWSLPNCIITPHVGNTPEMAVPLLAERITTNVRRYAENEELVGLVDVEAGY